MCCISSDINNKFVHISVEASASKILTKYSSLKWVEQRILMVLKLISLVETSGFLAEFLISEDWGRIEQKNGIFWNVMPFGSCKNRRFGGS
jgi:hypothetical protein